MTTKQTKNEDGFFPDGYEAPVNVSSFMKLEDGANLIRIVSNAVPGYEYWDVDNKPHRSKVKWETQPVNIQFIVENKIHCTSPGLLPACRRKLHNINIL